MKPKLNKDSLWLIGVIASTILGIGVAMSTTASIGLATAFVMLLLVDIRRELNKMNELTK
ncbi:MAG: hypothetical protein ACYC4S_09660 [Rhodoferax sp.]